MSIEFLINNPHLLPFFLLFFLGFVLIIIAPIHYRFITKSTQLSLTLKDFFQYSKFQKTLVFIGCLCLLIGILGSTHVSEKYGYNRVIIDIHGNRTIENSILVEKKEVTH